MINEKTYDPLVSAFHRAADSTDDAADHDELHAAARVIAFDYGDGRLGNDKYISRWIVGLRQRHGI